jgi:hypothetical protein
VIEGTAPPLLYRCISGRAKFLLFGCFSIFFFCIRIPQFTALWDGEDANGQLSAMLMGLASPNELVFSRIDGEAHYQFGFPHPIAPYSVISLIGKVIRFVVPFSALHGQTLIFALKATVSLLQLSIFLALIFLTLRYARTRVAVVWIWVMAATPVALYSSNEVQPDSSTGLLFIALFFMAAVIAQSTASNRAVGLLALLAGSFTAGLGKNEWAFCLAAALLFTALAHPLIHYVLARKLKIDLIGPAPGALPTLCTAFIGLACGNYASYLLNPLSYIGEAVSSSGFSKKFLTVLTPSPSAAPGQM